MGEWKDDTAETQEQTRRVSNAKAAAAKWRRKKREGSRTERLTTALVDALRTEQQLDADGDGKLSAAEIEAEKARLEYKDRSNKTLSRTLMVTWLATILVYALYSLLYDEKIRSAEVAAGDKVLKVGQANQAGSAPEE